MMEALEVLNRKTNQDWMDSLPARKLAELEFHDKDRKQDAAPAEGRKAAAPGNHIFYSVAGNSHKYARAWIGDNSSGRVFLDYACGNGSNAILAAQSGAELAIGIDLSSVSIGNARRNAESQGVAGNTCFVQSDCENTGLPDASIDTVICSGMLHHLDLDKAFAELARIIKPGGVCLGVEALSYNPVFQLYRNLTPNLRTEWEKSHILSLGDLKKARKYFDAANVKYWHLLSVPVSLLKGTFLFNPALKLALLADEVLLRVWPFRLMAWMFTFELRRKSAS